MSEPESHRWSVRWSGRTDPGRFRRNNEDAFLAMAFNARESFFLGKDGEHPMATEDFIFAVSDGMGGANAGEFASRIAVEKVGRILPQSFSMRAMGLAQAAPDLLSELCEEVHAEMHRMGRSYEECRGMGATLTLAWVTPGQLYFAHIGDSRLYYLPGGGKLVQVSEDHTHVAWLVKQGRITPAQAKFHPQRNLLKQALGGETPRVRPQLGIIDFSPGDRFLLCSDGLNEGMSDRVMADMLAEEPFSAQRFINESRGNSGRDNLTALIMDVFAQ